MSAASPSALNLPPAPDRSPGTAAIWEEPILIDSYLPEAPSSYPSFFRNRVYQGSSGRVYPLPFHERIDSHKRPHSWRAVHLENDWLRLVVLPELGGRIHVAYDKTVDYDIFYRNNVIKPALVGLAGPWISGGVEFNWPQHHRPATFLPTDVELEIEPDGSVVVWCSDHDPFARMKGMHGVRLRPDSSRIEVDVRLHNRDDKPQTFLWWANVAAAVNDDYQSFFPPDVQWIADHAKRATATYPAPKTPYYGVDYAARAVESGGDAGRIDWYRNIPVPTSYMVVESDHEFFGGYDHGRDAGFIHWAPREISPGKKQWTWGDAPFGHAWDANLTDTDGPYVELMAGVYTDNQPDFAFLAPGETKSFRQVWYPITGIGPAHAADDRLAVSLRDRGGNLVLSMIATEDIEQLVVRQTSGDGSERSLSEHRLSTHSLEELRVAEDTAKVEFFREGVLALRVDVASVLDSHKTAADATAPDPAAEPPRPDEIHTLDELVYVAAYLTQYRHATRSPVPYWNEVLRRDPGESRAHLALAWEALGRADDELALTHAESSVIRRTRWTPTPVSGEAHYVAGLAAERVGRVAHAKERFGRASWDDAFAVPARVCLARLHLREGNLVAAQRLLESALSTRRDHLRARNMLSVVLQRRGRKVEAAEIIDGTRSIDPLDAWARDLAGEEHVTADATIALDVAIEYADLGEHDRAIDMLDLADRLDVDARPSQERLGPLVALHRAAVLEAAGRRDEADAERSRAGSLTVGTCLASRLRDVDVVRDGFERAGSRAVSALMLGNWVYHVKDGEAAIRLWEEALEAGLTPKDAAVAHRNLAVACFNGRGDGVAATKHYVEALSLSYGDAKLLFERDQLSARLGVSAPERLAALESFPDALTERDDLVVTWAGLLADVGREDEACTVLRQRHFQPWECGEGQVLAVWERVCVALARRALDAGDATRASLFTEMAVDVPDNLGEKRHPLANVARLELLRGDVAAAAGRDEDARAHWELAAQSLSDFADMAVTPFSVHSADAVAALLRLERPEQAQQIITEIDEWIAVEESTPTRIDFFATSLPTMLLFDSDPHQEKLAELREIERALLPLRALLDSAAQPLR